INLDMLQLAIPDTNNFLPTDLTQVKFDPALAAQWQRIGEDFKLMICKLAQSYSMNSKVKFNHILIQPQNRRTELLSAISMDTSRSSTPFLLNELSEIDKQIEQFNVMEAARYCLQTATH
ncbi:hypothetical protein CU098_001639, partial [Rhizopus stolonifer]